MERDVVLPILMAYRLQDGPWEIRIDARHTRHGMRHIHLRRKGLRGEYSWNVDGTRHDVHRFPTMESALAAAKKCAAKHLHVGVEVFRFEALIPRGERLVLHAADLELVLAGCAEVVVLVSDEWFVLVELPAGNGGAKGT